MSIFSQLAQASSYQEPTLTDGESAIIAGSVFFFVFLIFIVSYAIHAFLLGRIFKKAGIEQWIAWVPFYNIWKTLQLGGQQGFWAVLMIIPFVSIVASIFLYIAMYNIGLKLQKDGWFVLLAIFFPIVWYAWLAFDGSKWNENGGTPSIAQPANS